MSRWSGAQRQKQRSGKAATGGEGWVMKGGWRDGQNPDSSDLSASPRSLWFILQGTKTYILRSRTWCELKNKTKPSGNLDNLGRGPDEKQRVQAGGCWKSPGYTGRTTWDWGWGQRRGWSGQGRGIRVNHLVATKERKQAGRQPSLWRRWLWITMKGECRVGAGAPLWTGRWCMGFWWCGVRYLRDEWRRCFLSS